MVGHIISEPETRGRRDAIKSKQTEQTPTAATPLSASTAATRTTNLSAMANKLTAATSSPDVSNVQAAQVSRHGQSSIGGAPTRLVSMPDEMLQRRLPAIQTPPRGETY